MNDEISVFDVGYQHHVGMGHKLTAYTPTGGSKMVMITRRIVAIILL